MRAPKPIEIGDGQTFLVIVQGDRIAAAACFLPLTTKPMRNLGTRHRAAIGITEDSDALAVVVSEETWRISAT